MEREHQVAVDAARLAGKAILSVWDKPDFDIKQKAGDKGPLTEADLASNDIILDALKTHFPDDGVLSEETIDDASRLQKSRVWIVDPLDGTREFTLRMPEFCVSIGLVIDGQPKVGICFNPANGKMVSGIVGDGCFLNGDLVKVTSHDSLAGARFLVSRSEMEKGWFEGYDPSIQLTPMGSVAYKFALVAAGEAEATFTPKPRNEWDLCGGVACLLAAGGHASDGSNTPYKFNSPDPLKIGVCGTNGRLHDAVMGLMKN